VLAYKIVIIIMQRLTRHVSVIRIANRRCKFYNIIVFSLLGVNADDFVEFRVSNTRGHSYKLYQPFSNVHLDQSFSQNALSRYGIVSLQIVLILAPCVNLNLH